MLSVKLFCGFRSSPDDIGRWYKFDDGEVSECKMDDDEVSVITNQVVMLNTQCASIEL